MFCIDFIDFYKSYVLRVSKESRNTAAKQVLVFYIDQIRAVIKVNGQV